MSEHRRQYDRQWRKENRGYFAVWHAINRANDLGREATLTLEEWKEIVARFGGRCAYCLKADGNSLDHVIPLSAGGGSTKDNCVPACRNCNKRKGGLRNGRASVNKTWVPHIASEFWPSVAEALYA